ncbi:MAG: carboxylating nicotinate-nucleotide diphosphorylase [Rhodothermales bacterium]
MPNVARTTLPPYLTFADLDGIIGHALAEDVGPGDVTTLATIPPDTTAEARFLAKKDGVLAGLLVAERVFAAVDPSLQMEWTYQDGDAVRRGTIFGTARGRAHSILTAERLALNLLQRMSGIATATRRMVEAIQPYSARLLDTRKTAPCLRLLDKWAVRLGGGENHRLGLFDMILIKDNHIAAAGGIREAVLAAQRYREVENIDLYIEIETQTLDDVRTVLEVGSIDVILLDNMVRVQPDGFIDTAMLEEAVALINGQVATEASGNVTLDTVPAIAATGVDYISCGALTHSTHALDLSLKIDLR